MSPSWLLPEASECRPHTFVFSDYLTLIWVFLIHSFFCTFHLWRRAMRTHRSDLLLLALPVFSPSLLDWRSYCLLVLPLCRHFNLVTVSFFKDHLTCWLSLNARYCVSLLSGRNLRMWAYQALAQNASCCTIRLWRWVNVKTHWCIVSNIVLPLLAFKFLASFTHLLFSIKLCLTFFNPMNPF